MSTFNNKIVIVTGAGSGIGKATALAYAQKGAKVVVSDINEPNGQAVVHSITANQGTAIFIKTDVAVREEVESMIAQTVQQFGRLDILVNNAGVGGGFAPLDQWTDKEWNLVIAVNQTGVFYCMRAALKVMKAQKGGAIVNVSSLAGLKGSQNMGGYVASKHAVVGLTRVAALEYARYNIRVNAVNPTVIETPMGMGFMDIRPDLAPRFKKSIPMRRFGQPEEVAKAILWLSSEDCSFTSGHCLPIDGGSMAGA